MKTKVSQIKFYDSKVSCEIHRWFAAVSRQRGVEQPVERLYFPSDSSMDRLRRLYTGQSTHAGEFCWCIVADYVCENAGRIRYRLGSGGYEIDGRVIEAGDLLDVPFEDEMLGETVVRMVVEQEGDELTLTPAGGGMCRPLSDYALARVRWAEDGVVDAAALAFLEAVKRLGEDVGPAPTNAVKLNEWLVELNGGCDEQVVMDWLEENVSSRVLKRLGQDADGGDYWDELEEFVEEWDAAEVG